MQLQGVSNINSPSGRGLAAMGHLLEKSPLFRMLDEFSAWEIDATSFQWPPFPADLMTLEARAVGGHYTPQAYSPNAVQTSSLAIHGAATEVDVTYKADARLGLRDKDKWFTNNLLNIIKQFAVSWEYLFFQGSGQTNNMKGLKTILDGSTSLPGYTGITGVLNAQTVTGGATKSCDISSSTNWYAFIEYLKQCLGEVENPNALIMNRQMASRLWTIGQDKYIERGSKDQFGNSIDKFDGVPIYSMLDTSILNSEPDDTSSPNNVTTSIYIASWGEQNLSVVTNSGFEYQDWDWQEADEKNLEKMEIRAAIKIQNQKAIRRIRNIKL